MLASVNRTQLVRRLLLLRVYVNWISWLRSVPIGLLHCR